MKREDPLVKKWREEAFKLFNNQCFYCGTKEKLNVHHVFSWAKYPGLKIDPLNSIVVCGKHHKIIHNRA